MGFFKKDEMEQNNLETFSQPKAEIKTLLKPEQKPEIKIEPREVQKSSVSRMKNLALFDADTILYIIRNFPTMSIEIQNGLNSLIKILEDTINYIEDRSSEIIQRNRDFVLSQSHRDKSIAIYEVVKKIVEYVEWMQEEYEKNMEDQEIKDEPAKKELKRDVAENSVEKNNKNLSNKIVDDKEIESYKDFSLKEPRGFRLGNNVVAVDDWDDLLVKTAEILTKQYKENKNSNDQVKEITPVAKKSTQNAFRDIVIEMLTEYKISLDKFKIIVK